MLYFSYFITKNHDILWYVFFRLGVLFIHKFDFYLVGNVICNSL